MKPLARVAPLLTVGLLLGGCAFGYNRVLFVTKTNAGLEATSTPPTIQLDIARTEGVIAPQFQNGEKLPVMASFRFANRGFFAPSVGSAFTTGDAALTMAALYGDRTPLNDWESRVSLIKRLNSPTDSTIELNNQPTLPKLFGLIPLTFQATDVRPVFFGTDTSLGIKIAWSGATGQFPDSARFGYNRTELALVPIAKEDVTGTAKARMHMASLMATVDAGVEDIGTAARPGLNFQLVQYFATGRAATLMAMQEDVRKAMLARLDPHKEEHKRKFEELSRQGRSVAVTIMTPLYLQLTIEAQNRVVARELVDRLDAVTPAEIAALTTTDFKNYDYSSPPALTDTTVRNLPGPRFLKLIAYRELLARSVDHLGAALLSKPPAGIPAATFDGAPLTNDDRGKLEKMLTDLTARLAEIDKRIADNQVVIRDGLDYFYR